MEVLYSKMVVFCSRLWNFLGSKFIHFLGLWERKRAEESARGVDCKEES
jgi:hypothetical protein